MKLNQPQDIQPTPGTTAGDKPTHLAIAIKPRADLTPNDRKAFAMDLLCFERSFRRNLGVLVEIEPQAASALLAGNWPPTVWARATTTLNGCRRFDESRREPAADDICRWQAFWGGCADGEAMMLLPLPQPAAVVREVRDSLRGLPALMRWRLVYAGTPQERLLRMLHRF